MSRSLLLQIHRLYFNLQVAAHQLLSWLYRMSDDQRIHTAGSALYYDSEDSISHRSSVMSNDRHSRYVEQPAKQQQSEQNGSPRGLTKVANNASHQHVASQEAVHQPAKVQIEVPQNEEYGHQQKAILEQSHQPFINNIQQTTVRQNELVSADGRKYDDEGLSNQVEVAHSQPLGEQIHTNNQTLNSCCHENYHQDHAEHPQEHQELHIQNALVAETQHQEIQKENAIQEHVRLQTDQTHKPRKSDNNEQQQQNYYRQDVHSSSLNNPAQIQHQLQHHSHDNNTKLQHEYAQQKEAVNDINYHVFKAGQPQKHQQEAIQLINQQQALKVNQQLKLQDPAPHQNQQNRPFLLQSLNAPASSLEHSNLAPQENVGSQRQMVQIESIHRNSVPPKVQKQSAKPARVCSCQIM